MKKITLGLILVCVTTFLSCKDEKRVAIEATQMQQVMAIHDADLMPKMNTISKLAAQLKPMADSLGTTSLQAKAMKDLKYANASMMDWMKGFGDRFDFEEIMEGKALSSQKQLWLNEEEEKIHLLMKEINSSIANAEALLKTSN